MVSGTVELLQHFLIVLVFNQCLDEVGIGFLRELRLANLVGCYYIVDQLIRSYFSFENYCIPLRLSQVKLALLDLLGESIVVTGLLFAT